LTLGLSNRIIAITTSGRSISEFSEHVIAVGGRVIALPTIDIIPREPTVVEEFVKIITSRNHEFCAFLSANAVDVLFNLARQMSQVDDLVSLLNSRIVIAIGPNTTKRLKQYKINVQMIPDRYSTKGLIEMLSSNKKFVEGKSIIIPRSGEVDDYVKSSLLNLGMTQVDEVFLYNVTSSRNVNNSVWREFVSLLTMRALDCLIFTSPSSVKALFKILKDFYNISNVEVELNRVKTTIAIGPLTWHELKRRGIQASVPEIHTIEGTFELARKCLEG
jgi:uroporphyrinogen-III synthase